MTDTADLKALALALSKECTPATLRGLEAALTAAQGDVKALSGLLIVSTASREVAEGRAAERAAQAARTPDDLLEESFARALEKARK